MHALDPWFFFFLILRKTTFPNSNSIRNSLVDEKPLCRRATYKPFFIIHYLSTAGGHLHSVLNHSNGTLLMDLVGAWQDQATAKRILCKVQKVGLITTLTC